MALYPVLEFDYKKHPHLADNVWHAQMAGHPKVLTYSGPLLKKDNRKGAMHYEVEASRYEIPHILSRDEYPFACTLEGGKASWVGHIPPGQNSAQGGLIWSFIRANGIVPIPGERSKFEVRVMNHPGGPAK
jgi:hypothetical protein